MKGYKHLSDEERTLISHYHDNGISIGEIGRRVGRNKSTISRELRRNFNKDSYKPDTELFAKVGDGARNRRWCIMAVKTLPYPFKRKGLIGHEER